MKIDVPDGALKVISQLEDCPPKGSIRPAWGWYAMAFIVKSRRERSSSICRVFPGFPHSAAMKIDVPDGALKVISQLEDAGYAAFLVGGCIRDSLLGRVAFFQDIDAFQIKSDKVHGMFGKMSFVLFPVPLPHLFGVLHNVNHTFQHTFKLPDRDAVS